MKTKRKLLLCLIIVVTLSSCKSTEISSNVDTATSAETTVSDVSISTDKSFVNSCNLASGGYVNFLNGKYYYSDAEHGNSIYSRDANWENAVCIDEYPNAAASCISVAQNAVYYERIKRLDAPLEIGDYSVLYEKQLCKYSDGVITVLSQENVLSYALSDAYIFYSAADMNVYRMRHDGSEKTIVFELAYPMNIQVLEDVLYIYMGEAVVTADFDGNNDTWHNIYHYNLAVNGSAVYYISADDLSLRKVDNTGDNDHIIVSEPICSFNVYNDKLLYERVETGEIVIADMDGGNPEKICVGSAPIVLNNKLFYLSKDNTSEGQATVLLCPLRHGG